MGRHQAEETAAPSGHNGLSVRLRVHLGVAMALLTAGAVWAFTMAPHAEHTATPAGPGPSTSPTGGFAGPADLDESVPPSAAGIAPTTPNPTAQTPVTTTPFGTGDQAPGAAPPRAPTPRAGPTGGLPPAPAPSAAPPGSAAPPAGAVAVQALSVSTWQGGYDVNYAVSNGTASTLDTWSVVLTFSVPVSGHTWNAQPTDFQNTPTVTLSAMSYNATIAPGKTQSFGLQALNAGVTPVPVSCTVNGVACRGFTTSR